MRQHELSIRIAQVHHLLDEHKYKKALAVIRTIDIKQVKGLSDLNAFAEAFTKTEQFEEAKTTYLRIYRKSRTRRVLYKLIYLAIRTNSLEEAESYYQEFVRMNPNARDALILRYKIDKAAGVPVEQLIEVLEALKEEEYIEEWAYELAKLYHKSDRLQECRDECVEILLWFGHGEIVDRAKKLIECIDNDEAAPYLDDKDFTEEEKIVSNPDDTDKLPDLNEYFEEENLAEEFIDDYEDTFDEIENADFTKLAKESLQKLSGLLKIGGKKEKIEKGPAPKEKAIERTKESLKINEKIRQESRDDEEAPKKNIVIKSIARNIEKAQGMTKDLSKEIAAMVEEEHREHLKEKAVNIIKENSGISDIEAAKTNGEALKKENSTVLDNLPTTRALHCSLEDVLKLIEGEPDPSHFVLVGSGEKRIIGMTKHIVKIMNKSGYASMGKIAKINAKALNEMKIDDFKKQLKGNCLLVENAAKLLFPTINKIFDLMEEFYGDFVVILADEGDTLDQLFKFTPALGKHFKYIIDINRYEEEDYE